MDRRTAITEAARFTTASVLDVDDDRESSQENDSTHHPATTNIMSTTSTSSTTTSRGVASVNNTHSNSNNNKNFLESPKCASLPGYASSSNHHSNCSTSSSSNGADNNNNKGNVVLMSSSKHVLVERNSNSNSNSNCEASTTTSKAAPNNTAPAVAVAVSVSVPHNTTSSSAPATTAPPPPTAPSPIEPPAVASAITQDDLDAVSVGLMASGLAWVRRQKSGRYGTVRSRYPLDKALQDQRRRLQQKQQQQQQQMNQPMPSWNAPKQQQPKLEDQPKQPQPLVLKKACSNDSAPQPSTSPATKNGTPRTPSRASRSTKGDHDDDDHLQIHSCPTSPFFVAHVVSENPLFATFVTARTSSKADCNSSGSISGSISASVSTSPSQQGISCSSSSLSQDSAAEEEDEVELAPSFNPVNTIYSLSNLLSGAAPTAAGYCSHSHSNTTTSSQELVETEECLDFQYQYYKTIMLQDDSNHPDHNYNKMTQVVNDNTINNNSNNHTYRKKKSKQDDDDYASGIVPLGYFCQDEGPSSSSSGSGSGSSDPIAKSPMRSALHRVLSRMGSIDYGEDLLVEDNNNNMEENHAVSQEQEDDGGSESDSDVNSVSWIPPVRCVPEHATTHGNNGTNNNNNNNYILNPKQMHQIARHVLPKGIAACQWKRLYSLNRDGDSFDVCLHYVQHNAKTLLIVRTTRGAIFGGFAGEAWTKGGGRGEGRPQYYGTNESCLFTFEEPKQVKTKQQQQQQLEQQVEENTATATATVQSSLSTTSAILTTTTTTMAPAPRSPPALIHRVKKSLVDDVEDDDDDEEEDYEASLPPIHIYKYTGVNRYIQICDASRKMLGFGGGGEEGSFGLCVEQEFQTGSTGPCDTFDNEPLCEQENFNIVDVEIWGFLTGHF